MTDIEGILGFAVVIHALFWGYTELAWYAEFREPQPMTFRVKVGYLTFAWAVFWVIASYAGRS